MLAMDASGWWAVSALGIAAGVFVRLCFGRRRSGSPIDGRCAASQANEQQLAELNRLILEARQQADRLEALLARSSNQQAHSLDQLDALGQADRLDDPRALADLAEQLGTHRPAAWEDPFRGEDQVLALARLADQGLSAEKIARRLNKPLGEVELMLSLR